MTEEKKIKKVIKKKNKKSGEKKVVTKKPRKQRKSKYTFTLENIDIYNLFKTYSIPYIDDEKELLSNNNRDEKENITSLSELSIEKGTPEIVSFLDETKRLRHCNISMIDYSSGKDVNLLRYNCFWCKHPFDTQPIGCPIKYIPSKAVKTMYSHTSRDTYIIYENITTNKRLQLNETDKLKLDKKEKYDSDGVFCSFNCCKEWIDDHTHIAMYDRSDTLLTKIYNKIHNTKIKSLPGAPHWRQLKEYGGNLNILEFRKGFNKVEYSQHGNMKLLPEFVPVSRLYEQKLNFNNL